MFSKKILASRLSALRKATGISQVKLGEALGISQFAISKIEKGERAVSIEVLNAIADYFDVPADFLLGRGVFANWEDIMEHKDMVFSALKYDGMPEIITSGQLDECTLIRVFHSLFAAIIIDGNSLTLRYNTTEEVMRSLGFLKDE